MKISEIMSDPVRAVRADATVLHATEMMALHQVGALPVTEDGVLVGIVTDRDIVLRCVAQGLSPTHTEIGRIMTEHPASVGPDDSVEAVAWIFMSRRIRRLPVVADGRPVGMVTLDDVARLWDDDVEILRMVRRVAPKNRSTRMPTLA